MKIGTLYGIGVGPGDPELLTLKAVRLLGQCLFIYLPVSRLTSQNHVADVICRYAQENAQIREISFSLDSDMNKRQARWMEPAGQIAELLRQGRDVAFVTLGDPLLYSTYIYLVRALLSQMPQACIETVPGINSFSLGAALTNFPLGEGKQPVTIVPTSENLEEVRRAIATGGTIVLMKIGRRLQAILDMLDGEDLLEKGVFVARSGLPGQVVETDLRKLRGLPEKTGNLAVILLHV